MAGTIIDPFFEPPWIYFLMVGGILFGTWYILKKYGLLPVSTEHFKGQTLQEIIQDDNLSRIVKTFGTKFRSKLIFNGKMIKVSKFVEAPAKISIRKLTKGSRWHKSKWAFTDMEKRFLIFKSGGGMFEDIPLLKYIHKGKEFYVIEDDERFIKADLQGKLWTINKNTFPHTFGGVWVFSQDGAAFLTELGYKKMQENDKEESVNALKRFIFYNDQHTGRISAMERRSELRDESWEKGKKQVDSE